MKIYLYHDTHFETWDWTNSTEQGIGGSETHTTEMAWRLARRGHDVTVYAPTPFQDVREWRSTRWQHYTQADVTQPGTWVIYRNPAMLTKFAMSHPQQSIWFLAQDEWYPSWKPEHSQIIDRFIPISTPHARSCLRHMPSLQGKVWISSNGIKCDLIREIEADGVPIRNPKRLMWASSPDRGLKYLLQSFRRAREYVPDLELHCFYGFDNIDKLIASDVAYKYFVKLKEEILRLSKQPGVTWHGRVSQRQLYHEWLMSGLWCYQTNFSETSCITCMEAQALGAIPITNPYWALGENVTYGVFIEGDAYGDPLTQARYAAEIVRLANAPDVQAQIRADMMPWARTQFNWERYVDQWEAWWRGQETGLIPHTQFAFQHQHAYGDILNIGCAEDPSNFKARGAVNVDVATENPILHVANKADVQADARALPKTLLGRFDTVILGDLLEHMSDADMLTSLRQAKTCLRNGGVVLVTCPNDARPKEAQHRGGTTQESYTNGVSCYHTRPISREHLTNLVQLAGLRVAHYQPLDYTHFDGHGMVLR